MGDTDEIQSKRTRLLKDDISECTTVSEHIPEVSSRPNRTSTATVTGTQERDVKKSMPLLSPRRWVTSSVSTATDNTGMDKASKNSSRARNISWSSNQIEIGSDESGIPGTELPGLPRIAEVSEQGLRPETTLTLDDLSGRSTGSNLLEKTFLATKWDEVNAAIKAKSRQLSTATMSKASKSSQKRAPPKRTAGSPRASDKTGCYSKSRRSRVFSDSHTADRQCIDGARGGNEGITVLRDSPVSETNTTATKNCDGYDAHDYNISVTASTATAVEEGSHSSNTLSAGPQFRQLEPQLRIDDDQKTDSRSKSYVRKSPVEVLPLQERSPSRKQKTKNSPNRSPNMSPKIKALQDRLFPASSAPAGLLREEEYKRSLGEAVVTFFATPATVEVAEKQTDVNARVKKHEDCWNDSEIVSAAVDIYPAVAEVQNEALSQQLEVAAGPSSSQIDLEADRAQQQPMHAIMIKRELCLYPICVLFAIVPLALGLIFFFPTQTAARRQLLEHIPNMTLPGPHGIVESRQGLYCTTAACSQDAIFLNHLLSWNVNPCDNFYQFVCSRWKSQYPETDKVPMKTTSDDVYAAQFEARMYTVLQNLTKDNHLLQPLRNLFRECVSTRDLEESGWDPLLELLALTSLEGFPFTPPVRSSSSVWKTAAKVLKMTGAAVLLNVDLVSHPDAKDRDIIVFNVPDTLVGSNGGDINESIRCYYSIVYTAIKALRKEFIPPVHTMQIVNFAYELERLFMEKGHTASPIVGKLSSYPELDKFASEIFDSVASPAYSGSNSDVLLMSPEFLTNLFDMVKKVEPHIVMNLLGVRLMVQTSAFTPQTNLVDVYSSLLYRKCKTSIPRWKLCVRVVENTMPPLFLLATLLDVRIQTVTTDLFKLVKAIVGEVIKSVDQALFLDDTAKTVAKNIITTTQYRVLGPAWVGDKAVVEEYLGSIPKVVRGQGLMSYALLQQHTFSTKLARDSSTRWTSSVFRTDCWNEDHPRAIYIPTLLFNVSLPASAQASKAFQLPRAGVRLAHCIFRMLLDDANSDPWMNEETRGKIEAVLRCLGDQYNFDQAASKSRLEDNAVIQPTLRHFVKIVRGLDNRTGLHLSQDRNLGPEQLFFIYLMLQSCERPVENMTNAEDNSLFMNVPLQNEPGFHKAFDCDTNTQMNPHQKCPLWKIP